MPASSDGRGRPTKLSAETKREIFLQISAGEISQAEAARKWQVDVSTVIGTRRTVKDAALAALARKPGRPGMQRDWQLEAARADIAPLTEAVKAQAIELAIAFSIAESILPSTSSTSAGRATVSILSGLGFRSGYGDFMPRTVCRKQSVQARGVAARFEAE
jgi:transposase